MRQVTYGEGGFDPSKPNDNIVEERDVDDAPVVDMPITVDPAALDDAKAAIAAATTVAGLRRAMSTVLDLLNPNTPSA